MKCDACQIELTPCDRDIGRNHPDTICPLKNITAGDYTWGCINAAIRQARLEGHAEGFKKCEKTAASILAEAELARQEQDKKWIEVINRLTDGQLNVIPIVASLCDFFTQTVNSDKPMMTEFGIKVDGTPKYTIRLWASKGQTPVERVAELLAEVAKLKDELEEIASADPRDVPAGVDLARHYEDVARKAIARAEGKEE